MFSHAATWKSRLCKSKKWMAVGEWVYEFDSASANNDNTHGTIESMARNIATQRAPYHMTLLCQKGTKPNSN